MGYKERLIELLNGEELSSEEKERLKELFPELSESEDEKMRKELLKEFKEYEKKYNRFPLWGSIEVAKAIAWLEKQGKQKPVWSEDDESHLRYTLAACREYIKGADGEQGFLNEAESIEWLKSLKDRVVQQAKQEWGKEDENMIFNICGMLHSHHNVSSEEYSKYYHWLESLRPQKRWKPSPGQLECLGYAIDKAEKDYSPLKNNRIYLTLKELRRQLKEL